MHVNLLERDVFNKMSESAAYLLKDCHYLFVVHNADLCGMLTNVLLYLHVKLLFYKDGVSFLPM